ncbi:hypothetical protein T07_4469 [Trichinella nelsoni]|uniref:Uncharacterized protein n=1 Tax=Trichinella nelsoni TaxID=6336 RepID=A0A0V0SD81_9BILA|nr:hypothetical protein T07_4469 [Trichinella nelsoni]
MIPKVFSRFCGLIDLISKTFLKNFEWYTYVGLSHSIWDVIIEYFLLNIQHATKWRAPIARIHYVKMNLISATPQQQAWWCVALHFVQNLPA